MRFATLAITLVTLSGCAQVREAVQDLDIPAHLREQTCKLYGQKARGQAENAWQYDWPVFAPMFAEAGPPEKDEAACRTLLSALGVEVRPMPGGRRGGMAVCGVVFFEPGFERWDSVARAATTCHELAHIVAQRREGCDFWLANYATVSGRLAAEGTAYALSDAIYERHGWSSAKIAGAQARRAKRFPERYRLEGLVEPECVADYFGRVRSALKQRSGF